MSDVEKFSSCKTNVSIKSLEYDSGVKQKGRNGMYCAS